MADRPPNTTTITPSGVQIDYYGPIGVDGEGQRRQYVVTPPGTPLPSVTTVLRVLTEPDGLVGAAVVLTKKGMDYREEWNKAGVRGTATHDLIVRMMAEGKGGSLSELKAEHRPFGQAAAKWLFDREPRLIESELMVATDRYAGRFDLVAEINGVVTRVDFKTKGEFKYDKLKKGRRLKPPFIEAWAQLSGYEYAARHCGYTAADAWLIVRLGPDGNYRETPVAYHPDRFLAYLAAFEAKRLDEADLKATTFLEPYPEKAAA